MIRVGDEPTDQFQGVFVRGTTGDTLIEALSVFVER
jgi:hypothetical protein